MKIVHIIAATCWGASALLWAVLFFKNRKYEVYAVGYGALFFATLANLRIDLIEIAKWWGK